MVSISLRSTSSEGGAGGALDMLGNLTPQERRLRRVSKDEGPFSPMVRDGARAPLGMGRTAPG